MLMKNILVPTDFSATAEKALVFALNFASRRGGKITLYHNYLPLENTFIDTDQSRKKYNDDNTSKCQAKLQELKDKYASTYPHTQVDLALERTPLIDHLLKFIQHHGINLVIMGTQGATGLKKVIVGSVASAMLEKSPVPVLLVPENYKDEEISKILFATSASNLEESALGLTLEFAKAFQAEVNFVHVFLYGPNKVLDEKEVKLYDEYSVKLRQKFSDFPLNFSSVESYYTEEAMEHLHDKIPYDLLVMVKRKKNFLQKLLVKSFTRDMAHVSSFPLLVIPEE